MKHLKKFKTTTEYTVFRTSADFIDPNISVIKEVSNNEKQIKYNKEIKILTFTANTTNSTIRLDKVGSPNTISLQYSTDNGITWNEYTWSDITGQTITLVNIGNRVMFKGTNNIISSSNSNYYQFVMNGSIAAKGYITSLLNEVGGNIDMSQYCFYRMFYGCASLTTAPELPSTTLAANCYDSMFYGCTVLTTAPELPATTLAYECYYSMFNGCTALTTAPELPATTLADCCYENMFYGCTNLNYIKALFITTPSITYTYNWVSGVSSSGVFIKNSSATWNVIGNNAVPYNWVDIHESEVNIKVPYISLDGGAYDAIVVNGGSSWNITSKPEWVTVSKMSGTDHVETITLTTQSSESERTGTIVITNGTTTSNVTIEQKALSHYLTLTSLDDNNYFSISYDGGNVNVNVNGNVNGNGNGSGSGSAYIKYSLDGGQTWNIYSSGDQIYLDTGENVKLRGNILSGLYFNISQGRIAASGDVTSLSNDVGGDIDCEFNYSNMFRDCTSLTTAPALPATTLTEHCYDNMFSGCTALTTAPALPATTLATYCYQSMFYGCESLTTAPELPAITLVEYCYQYMFNGCSNLNYIKALFTTDPSMDAYTDDWLYGVSSSGVFIKNSSATWTTTGNSAVPNNWVAIHEGEVNIKVPYMTLDGGAYDAKVVNGGASWSITSKPEWVTVSKMSGTNTVETITLTIGSTSSERTGTIVITNGTTTSNVTIEQKAPQYLTLTSLDDNNYFSIYYYAGNTGGSGSGSGSESANTYIEYSLDDGQTWNAYSSNDQIDLNTGENVKLRGNILSGLHFNISQGRIAASGDVTSLSNIYGGDIYCEFNYSEMFQYCTALTTAPELPATTLADYCYQYMFNGCTALTTAPALPATTLAQSCYSNMFYGCTSLTTAPALPATTLANYCYQSMFQGCTSLTTAPALPATTLTNNCYSGMFNGCTALTAAPALPATILANSCYYHMFHGCTALTTAPALPATTLAASCYSEMFKECTALTIAPALPATTLANSCYNAMFNGCTSLTIAPTLPATTLADYCYNTMFYNCTSLTTAPELPATTLAQYCYNYMFNGCTSLTTAPAILPATTLAQYCYASMFQYCTALTTAPALPATTLAYGCYRDMFYGCSNLNYIKALFTTTPSDTYTQNWVSGVSSNGVFIKNSSATWNAIGNNAVLYNWVAIYENEVNIKVPYISLDGGAYDAIVVNGGSSWNITSKPEWVTVSKMSGTDHVETITLTVGSTSSDRTGTVVITNGTTTSNVNIKQIPPQYLSFTANEANSTVGLTINGSPSAISLKYSIDDGSTWRNYTWSGNTGQTITLANIGDKVLLKGTNTTINSNSNYYQVVMTGSISASGDVTSLLNEVGGDVTLYNYCFYRMFYNCTALTTAPELPATTLVTNCYTSMFNGCTALTTAPVLPATTLANYCYSWMFKGCTSLTTAPELPITTLATGCYYGMFNGCTSLTTAPELPATTLAENCYYQMFYGCTNLQYIKALFTTTPSDTYTQNWVSGVSSTGVFIKNSSATWTTTGTYAVPSNWTIGDQNYFAMNNNIFTSIEGEIYNTKIISGSSWEITSKPEWVTISKMSGTAIVEIITLTVQSSESERTGTIVITNGTTTSNVTIEQRIPHYLTFTANEANSTVGLNKNGSPNTISLQYSIDDGSTWSDYTWSGTTGDTITLANIGDKVVFKGTNTTISTDNSNYYKFVMSGSISASGDVTSLLNELGGDIALTKTYCFNSMFNGCASLTTAPALPATTLANNCYQAMFRFCSALTTAPVLPATTLAQSCYRNMFAACTALTTAPALPATTLAYQCYYYMFNNCIALTTAPELPATTLAENCYASMFSGCSNLNYIKAMFTTTPSTSYTSFWVNEVSATGTFVKNSAATWTNTGTYAVPSGWTVETASA